MNSGGDGMFERVPRLSLNQESGRLGMTPQINGSAADAGKVRALRPRADISMTTQENETLERHVQNEQLAAAIRTLPLSLATNVVIAAAATLLLAHVAPSDFLKRWITLIVLLSLARGYAAHRLRASTQQARRALSALALGAFLNGALWSLLALNIPSMTDSHGYIVLLLITGLSSGAVARSSSFALLSIGLIAPLLSVTLLRLLTKADEHASIIAFVTCVFFIFLLRSARQSEKNFKEAVRVKHQALANFRTAQLYHQAMEHSPFGMFISDPEGKVLKVNPSLCQMLGREEADLLGDGLSDCVHLDDLEKLRRADEKLANSGKGKTSMEIRLLRGDGVTIWAYTERSLVNDPGTGYPAYIVGQIGDIDSRKRREEEVILKGEQRCLAVQLAQLGEMYFDAGKGQTTWSERACEIFGVDPQTVFPSTATWLALVHPDDCERMARAAAKGLAPYGDDGRASNARYRIVRPDGAVRHLVMAHRRFCDAKGFLKSALSVIQDVTEEAELKEALHKEKIELAKALGRSSVATDVAGIGIYEYNAQTRETLWDDRLCEIFGVDPDNFAKTPKAWLSLVHPQDRARVITEIRDAENRRDSLCTEYRIIRPSGEVRSLRVASAYEYDAQNLFRSVVSATWDITTEVRRLEELHEAKELAQVTISSASEGIVRTGPDGRITLCNNAAARMAGATPGELEGKVFGEAFRFSMDADKEMEDPAAAVLRRKEPMRLTSSLRLRDAAGGWLRVNLSIAPMFGKNRTVIGVVALVQDASEIAQLTERLTRLAYSDTLTGVANRRAFDDRLENSVRAARDRRRRDFLLVIDLDHFKIVNDECGHQVGDALLKDIAWIFRSQIRSTDFLARLGGDEFAIILEDSSEDGAARIAEEIVGSVNAYRLEANGATFSVGASIGIAEVMAGADASTVTSRADAACYKAKSLGRGRFCLFRDDDEEIVQVQQSHSWFNRIQNGLRQHKFRLFLQEIVDDDRRTVGYEALLRFIDGGEVISPAAFMPAAARHGLQSRLDRFIVRSVLSVMSAENFSVAVPRDVYLSVNLSAASLADPAFRQWLKDTLDSHIHLAPRLWLELTESEKMQWNKVEIAFLGEVRKLGIRIYLDDFGTGYNSFDILKKTGVDGLKLDYSVTRNVLEDPVDQALVGASLTIARSLGLEVVAEGVEGEAAFEFLRRLGVKKFQGYLFHRAEAASAVIAKGLSARPARTSPGRKARLVS